MRILIKVATLFLVATLIFGSCTSQKELTYLSNLDTTRVEQFFPMERPEYLVQNQDILHVDIYSLDQEMNEYFNSRAQTFQGAYREASSIYIFGYSVSDSGSINLPIIGEVYVQGYTTSQIRDKIQKRVDTYLKDASVNVKLLTFKYTVIGEVYRPGTFTNFNKQLTVLEAISMGGDITDYGNKENVLVIRPTEEGSKTYRINLQDKSLLQSEGYFLLPNDIVIVEPIESKPFNLNLQTYSFIITTIFSTITTTLVLITYFQTK